METETMIRQLKCTANKHMYDILRTFDTNITALCNDVIPKLERLKEYEDTGLTPEEIMDGRLLTGWIPVTEQLPPQPRENPVFENKPVDLYLVCVNGTDYPFRAFWNGTIFTDGWGKQDVIAWMPLPEPYKERAND